MLKLKIPSFIKSALFSGSLKRVKQPYPAALEIGSIARYQHQPVLFGGSGYPRIIFRGGVWNMQGGANGGGALVYRQNAAGK